MPDRDFYTLLIQTVCCLMFCMSTVQLACAPELQRRSVNYLLSRISPGNPGPACPAIQGISNQVWACKSCNSSKNDLGLYAYFKWENPTEKKYFDILPALLEKKYLKTIYKCHECAGDLDSVVDGLSVLDLDFG